MIPRTTLACQSVQEQSEQTDSPITPWQTAFATAFREPAKLLQYLELPQSLLEHTALMENNNFSLRAPLSYCQRIEKGNVNDPLLRQILPLNIELDEDPAFNIDPVEDLAAQEVPGLLHKYSGRVLIIMTEVCAIHCRYCFRRHFPYQENRHEQNWQDVIDYIRADPSIHEVILSGGDPLSLTETKLKQLTDKLITVPHIKTLRLHTRQPIVLPERINGALLDWLDSLPWNKVVVLHCNHANEIDSLVATAIQQLKQHNVTLLNQSVLLAGVNDDADVLAELSEKLFSHHVLPYYLHQLDKVQGAKHFYVSDEKARQLVSKIRQSLPGYLVPKLVVEEAGKYSKTPLI